VIQIVREPCVTTFRGGDFHERTCEGSVVVLGPSEESDLFTVHIAGQEGMAMTSFSLEGLRQFAEYLLRAVDETERGVHVV
jgi:hypothetical protein